MPEVKILVIEDDPDLLAITSKRLEKLGFVTLKALNLSEAQIHLDESHTEIGAVISDLFLGNENGLNFFDSLAHESPHLPFILVTGDEDGDSRVRKYLAENKNFFCLQKPYTMDTLKTTLTEAKVNAG